MIKHRRAGGLAVLVADVVLFSSTDAGKVPSFLLIVGFLLLVATVYWLVYELSALGKWYGLPMRHRRRLTAYITVLTGMIVALQSTGELGARDVLVLLPLVVLGYAYTNYAVASKRNLSA